MASTTRPRRSPKAKSTSLVCREATVLNGRHSAWLRRHAENGERRLAPGAPGDEPRWAASAKDGVGTALCPGVNSTNLVWFTLGRGALTEIY
jgi:glucodextranase-like protein